MATKRDEVKIKDVPDIIIDPSTQKQYRKGKFLGKVYSSFVFELEMLVNHNFRIVGNISNINIAFFCFVFYFELSWTFILHVGWICTMLRAHRHGHENDLCWKNCSEVAANEVTPTRKGKFVIITIWKHLLYLCCM